MTHILRVRVVYLALFLLIAFVPVAWLTPPNQLYMMLGCILLTTSTAAVWQYWPVISQAICKRLQGIDKVELLAFGLILLFAGTAFREAYITVWREFFPLADRRPGEFFYPLAFIRYTCIVATIVTLTAKDWIIDNNQHATVPGWPAAIMSTFLGVVLGTFMVYWLL